jgi:hypothetical protein
MAKDKGDKSKVKVEEKEASGFLGMTESFRQAVKEKLVAMVGEDRVSEEREALEEFAQDYSSAASAMPEMVVRPASIDRIPDIVKLANDMEFTLIPVSSSPPHFHADTVPSGGEVILDLRDVNNVLWVDRRNRVAIIESGVTFDQLLPELEKEGLRLTMPLLPKPGKSVLASCLEREPQTMPRYHYDMSDPLCSAEFVLGYGDIYRTGEIGMARGDWKEQRDKWKSAQKTPFGRYFIDIKKICQGAQGSLGILAWASLRLELLPEIEKVFCLSGESLDELIEPAYELIHEHLADDIYILNSTNLACMLREQAMDIEKLRDKSPPWILIFTLGGFGPAPEEMFDYRMDLLKDTAIPVAEKIGDIESAEVTDLLVRKASKEPYWKLRLRGDVRELFFLTTISRTPSFVELVQDILGKGKFPLKDMGIYIQPMLHGNCCHLEFDLYFPLGENEGVEKIISEASRIAFEKGAFFSRPYGEWSDMVYGHYSHTHKIIGKVKEILDPNRVLSPGRLGL